MNALICPSCSGQMKLAEAKPGDKIARCEYCNTVVDLPDEATKQNFDLGSFFENFTQGNNNTKNTTTTISTSKVVIMNGKVMNGGNDENTGEILENVKKTLAGQGIHIDGLTDTTRQTTVKNPEKTFKKGFFKKLFGG